MSPFPVVPPFLVQISGLLARQLLRWTRRRSLLKGFSHFSPPEKKCDERARVECATGRALQLIHPDDLVFPRMLIWQSADTFFCRGHVWCVRLEPSLQKYYFFRKDEGRSQWQPPLVAIVLVVSHRRISRVAWSFSDCSAVGVPVLCLPRLSGGSLYEPLWYVLGWQFGVMCTVVASVPWAPFSGSTQYGEAYSVVAWVA